MKVLLTEDIAAQAQQFLREQGFDLVLAAAADPATLQREVAGASGLIVRTAKLPAEVLAAADCLQVVARHGVGVDNVDVAAATRLGIQVTNTPLANVNAVAEHTVALIAALSKQLLPSDRAVHQGNWQIRNSLTLLELQGSTVGIAGLGRIGRSVAQKLHLGLGMRVVGYDPYAQDLPAYVTPVSLDELLAQSDIVSLHLPSTPQTKGLFGAAQFAAMKPQAYFLNLARGEIVDEAALYQALSGGQIAGAAVDVLCQEPPPENSPLLTLANLLVTPHTAAFTARARIDMAMQAAQSVVEVLNGQKPSWPVNHLQ